MDLRLPLALATLASGVVTLALSRHGRAARRRVRERLSGAADAVLPAPDGQRRVVGSSATDAARRERVDAELHELRERLDTRERELAALRRRLAAIEPRTPAPADDLQRIHGLGPVSEAALHEAGVTRFVELIALLEGGDAERIATIVPIGVDPEVWLERARALARGEGGDG